MTDYETLKIRIKELADREWDRTEIEARLKNFHHNGIPPKKCHPDEIIAHKQEILARVPEDGSREQTGDPSSR